MAATNKSAPPYGQIVFDCDSTLSSIEGIEELAGPEARSIAALTERAMEGEIALEAVYGARLELIRPTRAALETVGQRYIETALPHAHELVAALASLGKRVHILSGGLAVAVRLFADDLGLEPERVHAVETMHAEDGAFLDFDRESPLARSGGKPELIAALLAEAGGEDPDRPELQRLALVGDGATDLEAAALCARFVAFGGVQRRAAVFAGADATCALPDLAALLPLLCDLHEIDILRRDVAFHSLIASATLHGGI